MPATVLSISAVSFSAGTLTSTAHGQTTGNGPFNLFVGSGGALPTGLAAVTNYWLIVVDANTVKVATSAANALANVPVTFSSNGTLPLSLLGGIPYTQATTYVAGVSQIKSDDLNSIQLALEALWRLLTAQAQSIWSAIALAVNVVITGTLNVSGDVTIGGTIHHAQITRRISPLTGQAISTSGITGAGSYATTVQGAWKATAAGQTLLVPLPVYVGEEIINVRAMVNCGTTDQIQMEVWRLSYPPGGGPGHAQLGAAQTSAGHASTTETLSVNGLNELPFNFNSNYFVTLNAFAFATAPTVYAIELDVSVP